MHVDDMRYLLDYATTTYVVHKRHRYYDHDHDDDDDGNNPMVVFFNVLLLIIVFVVLCALVNSCVCWPSSEPKKSKPYQEDYVVGRPVDN